MNMNGEWEIQNETKKKRWSKLKVTDAQIRNLIQYLNLPLSPKLQTTADVNVSATTSKKLPRTPYNTTNIVFCLKIKKKTVEFSFCDCDVKKTTFLVDVNNLRLVLDEK